MEDNTKPEYWKSHKTLLKLLSAATGFKKWYIRRELANIAEDYANMKDSEVIETFLNDSPTLINL